MSNDFDFIKNKFDNDGVEPPKEMDKDFVMQSLDGVSPRVVKMPRKAIAGVIGGLVACVAVFAIVVSSISTPTVIESTTPIVAEASELKTFGSYDELRATLKDMNVGTRIEYGTAVMKDGISASFSTMKGNVDESASDTDSATGTEGASTSFAETYKQVADVDEADIIKTDGEYIYYLTDSMIKIYPADGEKTKLLKSVKYDKDDHSCNSEMFVHNDNIIVISYNWDDDKTTAFIYDKSDAKNTKLVDKFSQSGEYISSRMIGDELYIVTNDYIKTRNDVPYVVCKDKKANLNYDCIVAVEKPSQPAYLVVSRVDTDDMDSDIQTKALLGASRDVYCNVDNMYVTSTVYNERIYDDDNVVVDEVDGDVADSEYVNDQTQIVKISLKDDIRFVATARIDGYIDDQYAMDEKDGYFRIATTCYNEDGDEVNNLIVFDEKLNEVGKASGFAPNESIKAVKYIGDTAYVITYEETDPLFVIDLHNPRKPKILGECKISGFSTMLVPVGEDRLMGIGYYTQDEDYTDMEVQEGIKIALFDISDKTNPKVLDEQVFKGYSSEVQYQPKALVYDEDKDTYFMPYETYIYDADAYSTGVLGIKIDGKEIAPAKRYKVNTDEYDTISRCTFVDDYLYMFTLDGNIHSSKIK